MKLRKMNGAKVWVIKPSPAGRNFHYMEAADWLIEAPINGISQGHYPCKFLVNSEAMTVEVLGKENEDNHSGFFAEKIKYRNKVLKYLAKKKLVEVEPLTFMGLVVAAGGLVSNRPKRH